MYCKHCGKSIDEDSTFCRFCGKPQGIIVHTESSFEKPIPTAGKANGHEWVDLGLSVKWATCNIGAKDPTEKGQFFAWGETEPKGFYSEDTYKLKAFGEDIKKLVTILQAQNMMQQKFNGVAYGECRLKKKCKNL